MAPKNLPSALAQQTWHLSLVTGETAGRGVVGGAMSMLVGESGSNSIFVICRNNGGKL